MTRNVGAKSGQYGPVETFYLTVGLRVVGGREIVVHVEHLVDVLEVFRGELETVFGDYVD